jgi:hypothetical protein
MRQQQHGDTRGFSPCNEANCLLSNNEKVHMFALSIIFAYISYFSFIFLVCIFGSAANRVPAHLQDTESRYADDGFREGPSYRRYA